jgi:hypothetical protein
MRANFGESLLHNWGFSWLGNRRLVVIFGRVFIFKHRWDISTGLLNNGDTQGLKLCVTSVDATFVVFESKS